MNRALGAELNSISKRYYANYNKLTHVWRILDLQHEDAQKLKSFDDEIPDTSGAITIIPELMFVEIISESTKLGLIRSFGDVSVEMQDTEKIISKLKEENKNLKENNEKLQEEVKGTEPFRIKNRTLDILQKIAIAEDITSLK